MLQRRAALCPGNPQARTPRSHKAGECKDTVVVFAPKPDVMRSPKEVLRRHGMIRTLAICVAVVFNRGLSFGKTVVLQDPEIARG